MKVWLKLLIGSILGILLGLLLPGENQAVTNALTWLGTLAIQVGRYILLPVLFFSLAVAVYELRQEGKLREVAKRSFLIAIGAAFLFVLVGLIVVMLFPPARIPILKEGQKEAMALGLGDALLDLFPSNAFSVFACDGNYILPMCLLAVFLGSSLVYDRNYTRNLAALIDSLARIFYHISAFFSEILGIAMIILGAYWAVRFRDALSAQVFRDLIILLGISSVILGFGVLPLCLYFLGPKINPWKQLYGALGPAIAGFFSGDMNFTLPILFRHAKENHGVKRRANTVSLAIFATFGRAGSAMVSAVSLIVIIKSYSSLGVGFGNTLAILFSAVGISLLLARHPGDGAFVALAVLCGVYGQGFEAGYLILKPIAFYLIAIGTFLDVLVASIGTYVVGHMCGLREEKEALRFI